MQFRQFILITTFSVLAGAGLAKVVAGPAPAQSYAFASYASASGNPTQVFCDTRTGLCR